MKAVQLSQRLVPMATVRKRLLSLAPVALVKMAVPHLLQALRPAVRPTMVVVPIPVSSLFLVAPRLHLMVARVAILVQ